MLSPQRIDELALLLDQALLARQERERLTVQHPDLTLPEAYAIQRRGIELRGQRGERIVGYKMGLTSEAKRVQMGLTSPIYGVLTDAMQVPDGGELALAAGIHPKVEPEIAFRLARDLTWPLTPTEALQACDGVAAALEILDSRYVGFRYFSLPDVVADDASSWKFVVGPWLAPQELQRAGVDLAAVELRMAVDGQVVQAAKGAAISGHPLQSLVQLAEMAAEAGLVVPAGSIVLAGAATVAEMLRAPMSVDLQVDGLLPCGFRVV